MPRARPGATTLLAHPTLKSADGKPAPVLVAADAGKGRTLALLTDSGWHWGFLAAGEGDDGRAFQRFWENAIRWLVRDPALTLLRLELDRLEYRRNQPIAVRVRGDARRLLARAGRRGDAGRRRRRPRRPAAKPLRSLHATTDARRRGPRRRRHAAARRLPADRAARRSTARPVSQDETFVVRAGGPELDDVAARDKVLREIAQASAAAATRSRSWTTSRSGPRARCASAGSSRSRSGRRPPLLLLGVALLALEWALRRRMGHS